MRRISHVMPLALLYMTGCTSSHEDRPSVNVKNLDTLVLEERQQYANVTAVATGPTACLALSGGGMRAAAFSLGVMRSLARNGLLDRFDIVSATSGGSWALGAVLDNAHTNSRDAAEVLRDDAWLRDIGQRTGSFVDGSFLAANLIVGLPLGPFERLVATETSSTHDLYESELRQTFHNQSAASQWSIIFGGDTGLPAISDLGKIAREANFPYPIILATLVEGDVRDLDTPTAHEVAVQLGPQNRFELTPLGFGSPIYGYWPVRDDFNLDRAEAVSGAAVTTNGQVETPEEFSKYKKLIRWTYSELGYVVREAPSVSEGNDPRIEPPKVPYTLVDGGFADNLSMSPLLARDCQKILLVDAEIKAPANGSIGKCPLSGQNVGQSYRSGADLPTNHSGHPVQVIALGLDRQIAEKATEGYTFVADFTNAADHCDFPLTPTAKTAYSEARFRAAVGYGEMITDQHLPSIRQLLTAANAPVVADSTTAAR